MGRGFLGVVFGFFFSWGVLNLIRVGYDGGSWGGPFFLETLWARIACDNFGWGL